MKEVQADGRLKRLWQLSWPAIVEQLLVTMVSYVDTAMVGVLGAAGTAAVSVNAAPLWLGNGLLTGVGVGYSVQLSNAVGAGDDKRAREILRQGVLAVAVVGLAVLLIYQSLAGVLPKWLGAKEDVLPQAVAYLRLYTLASPFTAASFIFSAMLRCMGNTRTPLYFNTAANGLNVLMNFLMIYPTRTANLFGYTLLIPGAGLGAAGAAAASAISLTVAGSAMLVAGIRQGPRFRVHLRECFRPQKDIIRQAVYLGLPSAVERATINLGQIATTAMVASLGTVALAANQIATTAEGLCYLPAYGISYAGVALVGQSVGAGSRKEASAYGTLAAKLGFLFTTGTAAVLFLIAPLLTGLFNSDPQVSQLAAQMLRIVVFSEPFFALSIVCAATLRGALDVRFPMVVSLASMWGVRIVLALLMVYGLKLGLAGVWLAMDIDLIVRGILCALRWRSGRWARICGLDRPSSK